MKNDTQLHLSTTKPGILSMHNQGIAEDQPTWLMPYCNFIHFGISAATDPDTEHGDERFAIMAMIMMVKNLLPGRPHTSYFDHYALPSIPRSPITGKTTHCCTFVT